MKFINLLMSLFLFLLLISLNYYVTSKISEQFISNQKKFNNYRLGDIYSGYIYQNQNELYNNYEKEYHNTIASRYISKVKRLPYGNKFKNQAILYDIINIKNKPKNGINLHLRLGDVITGFENGKFIFFINKKNNYKYGVQPYIYKKLCNDLIQKTSDRTLHIYYGSHNNFTKYSIDYLNVVKNIFKNNGFKLVEPKSFNPDIDFTEMSKSNIFIQSLGGYSRYISDIVKMNGGNVMYIKDYE